MENRETPPITSSSSISNSLEWEQLIQSATEFVYTELGEFLLENLQDPATWAETISEANLLQQETADIFPHTDKFALWGGLQDLRDPEPYIEAIEKGIVLEPQGLHALAKWMRASADWEAFPREGLSGEIFKRDLNRVASFKQPILSLAKILTDSGELAETASPLYFSLHQEVRATKLEIQRQLDLSLQKYQKDGLLQERYTDVMDGKFVIPVKISEQGKVPGVIAGSSVTKQTVFIEPEEVAQANQKYRVLQMKLNQEAFRILERQCKEIFPLIEELRTSVEVLAYWDFVQAKARWSQKVGGRRIDVSSRREIRIQGTLHPQLLSMPTEEGRNAPVRNDLEMLPPHQVLLISGPNTGGKTVFLKTIGLCALCSRTGFFFPADKGISFPWIDQIFTDVGDGQSIEQNLSSFSSHILHFKKIIEEATSSSLILLDELNAATDPEEGAALAHAFLDELISRGSIVIVTTHDPRLKLLGLNSENRAKEAILSASTEFDEKSLKPTYRVIPGIPGQSRAFETAKRLGLPQSLLNQAKTYISDSHQRIENLISELQKKVSHFEQQTRRLEHELEQATRAQQVAQESVQKIKTDWVEKNQSKFKRVMEDLESDYRARLKELKSSAKVRHVDLDAGSKGFQQLLTDRAPELATELSEELNASQEVSGAVVENIAIVGNWVKVPKFKGIGKITDVSVRKVTVLLGNLPMQLDFSEIYPLSEVEKAAVEGDQKKKRAQIERAGLGGSAGGGRVGSGGGSGPRGTSESRRIDIRGKRLDVAIQELERFLDQAAQDASRNDSSIHVTVIHGLGTGALREGSRSLIASLPYVSSFKDGGPQQGGAGATVLEIG